MLYPLILPDETRECLLDLTQLQLDLLSYAATTMPLPKPSQKPAERKNELIATCAHYLDGHSTHYKGHGNDLANYFFQRYPVKATNKQEGKSEESDGGRFKLLEAFAIKYRDQPGDEKKQWLARLRQEIEDLAADQPSTLIIQNFYDEDTPGKKLKTQTAGKAQAGQFLLTFYDNYLGDSNSKIPEAFLTSTTTSGFGRRQLLELFHQKNELLQMCAVCDETRFYTRYETQDKTGKVQRTSHAVLDHFLPKSIYPHLCCHPYNLVPICYSCNSPVKSTLDPLIDQTTWQRRRLHRDALPYGKFNISEYAYLKVSHESSAKLITSHEILARNPNQPYAQESIKILQDTFKLSNRWFDGNIPAERVMDALFRRMRHFLGNGKGNPLGANIEDEIDNMLRLLLYYIDHEDKQKDPLTFAMSWVLASFLKEHEKEDSYAWRGLVDEITSWFGQDLEKSKERNDYVLSLLNVLNEPSQKKINQNAALQ